MRPIALLAVCVTAVLPLGGCMLPPAATVASWVADGVSMVTSGKTVSDNAISTLAGEDCQLFRLLKGEWICHAETKVVAVAELPPAPPEPPLTVVSPYPRPAEPILATVEPVTPPAPLPALTAAEHAMTPAPATAPASATASAPAASASPATPAKPPAPAMAQLPAELAPARPAAPPVPAKPARVAPPAQQQAAVPAPTPAAARALAGPPVRGEMVIQSGTSQADAEAIAGQLKGSFPAKVRPVEKNGVTTYEVVVGLAG